MKLQHARYYKCQDGYAVGHPYDANPVVCHVDTGTAERWPLFMTEDHGETWVHVGDFVRGKMDEVGQFVRIEYLEDAGL